jgi:hypothetical protein
MKGHHYDEARRLFDARQAAALGMRNMDPETTRAA